MWARAYCSSCPGTFAWSPVPVNVGKKLYAPFLLINISYAYSYVYSSHLPRSFHLFTTMNAVGVGWGWFGFNQELKTRDAELSFYVLFFFFSSSYEPSLATFLPNWTCRFWTFIPNRNIWFPLIHGFFSSFLNVTLMLWAVFGNNKNIIEINLFNSTSHRHHVCTRWYSACDINVE